MRDLCKAEGLSSEDVFFCFFFCSWLDRYGLSKHKVFVWEEQLMKILRFSLVGTKKKKLCRIVWSWNFKGVAREKPIYLEFLRIK